MSGTPWVYGPKQFDLDDGISTVVQLNVPSRAIIRGMNMINDGGGGGTWELYNSEELAREAAAEANGSSVSVSDGENAFPAAIGKILNGSLSSGSYASSSLAVTYVNSDGTPSNPVRRLWLVVRPAAAGRFTLMMTFELPWLV